MGGGSQKTSQTGTTTPTISPLIRPLEQQSVNDWTNLLSQAYPQLSEIINPPSYQIPTETGQEQNLSSQLQGIAAGSTGTAPNAPFTNLSPLQDIGTPSGLIGETNPYATGAQSMISQLTGGPIGSSPATLAGMQAFKDIQLPQVTGGYTSQAGGGGVGGGLTEATAMAQESAAVPLIQQEIANREAAVGQLSDLSQQDIATQLAVPAQRLQFEQAQSGVQQAQNQQALQAYQASQEAKQAAAQTQLNQIQAAGAAAALPRDIATQQEQQDMQSALLGRTGVEEAALGPLMGILSGLVGGRSTSTGTQSGK